MDKKLSKEKYAKFISYAMEIDCNMHICVKEDNLDELKEVSGFEIKSYEYIHGGVLFSYRIIGENSKVVVYTVASRK